jgi:hypothetical protein
VVERTRATLRAELPAAGGKVLVQYSGYGFGHFGYPRWLLRALIEWKKESGGLLVVMFHEIWTFWPLLNKNRLVQELHRGDLRRLLAVTDVAFTSTASQAEHLAALHPQSQPEVLPVGSSIEPHARGNAPTRDPELAVLFGLQGSRLRTLQSMEAGLKTLAATGRIRRVVTAGAGNDPARAEEEEQLLQSLHLSGGYQLLGAIPAAHVSDLLTGARFALSAQDPLSVTKSSTFMAYAAHRLLVLSPFGGASREEPLCWAASPAELAQGMDEAQLTARADALHRWHERTCSWERIAERFARALQMDVQPRPCESAS